MGIGLGFIWIFMVVLWDFMKYYAVGETGIRKNWSLNYKLMIEHLFFEVPYLQTSLYMVTSQKKQHLDTRILQILK